MDADNKAIYRGSNFNGAIFNSMQYSMNPEREIPIQTMVNTNNVDTLVIGNILLFILLYCLQMEIINEMVKMNINSVHNPCMIDVTNMIVARKVMMLPKAVSVLE